MNDYGLDAHATETTELARLALGGDAVAFTRLMQLHAGAVHAVALSQLRNIDQAEDLTQEVFLRAYLQITSLRQASQFAPWLMKIARNLASNWRRDAQRVQRLMPLIPLEEIQEEPVDMKAPDPRDSAIANEQHKLLREAILELPEGLREVVLMHYAEDMTKSEIARILDVHPSSVMRQLERAHDALRSFLEPGLRECALGLRGRSHSSGRTAEAIFVIAAMSAGARETLAMTGITTDTAISAQTLTGPALRGFPLLSTPLLKGTLIASLALAGLGLYNLWKTPRSAAITVNTGSSEARIATKDLIADAAANKTLYRMPDAAETREGVKPTKSPVSAKVQSNSSVQTKASSSPSAEMLPVTVQIIDESSAPVHGAFIRIDGLHPKVLPEQSHYAWSGEQFGAGAPPEGKTDRDGRIAFQYPRYLYEKVEVGAISFKVSHAHYASVRQTCYAVNGTSSPLILKRANSIVVSVWISNSKNRITDFSVELSADAMVLPASWQTLNADQKFTNSVADGNHLMFAKHTDLNGRVFFSDAIRLKLHGGIRKELELELKPSHKLRGKVSSNVPRPVKNGKILCNMEHTPFDETKQQPEGPGLFRLFPVEVAEDGTFMVENLPPGYGEVIGICDGWISSYRTGRKMGYGECQSITLEAPEHSFELQMERTAALKVTVLDERLKPLPEADLFTQVFVFWANGYSTNFIGLQDKWKAKTALDGTGKLENLREAANQRFEVAVSGYVKPISTDKYGRKGRGNSVELKSGALTETIVTMVREGADQISTDDIRPQL